LGIYKLWWTKNDTIEVPNIVPFIILYFDGDKNTWHCWMPMFEVLKMNFLKKTNSCHLTHSNI
jgi:hypothetical protein